MNAKHKKVTQNFSHFLKTKKILLLPLTCFFDVLILNDDNNDDADDINKLMWTCRESNWWTKLGKCDKSNSSLQAN